MSNRFLPTFLQKCRANSAKHRTPPRRLRLESLTARDLFSNVPLGAAADDTGEFMLGDVTVNVVLFESNGSLDANTENWTPSAISQVKQKIEQGMQWWVDSLHAISPNAYLHFNFDYTYADQPVSVPYEPISRPSEDYPFWADEFLNQVGYLSTGPNTTTNDDVQAFNNHSRIAHDSNWSFTIFVVNNANDADKQFDPSGSFLKAFAFAGDKFMVLPADRPVSSIAHETGHMFWAGDEYAGGDHYSLHRGYYDTPLANAADGNPNPANRLPSIMASDALFNDAFANHTSSPTTLAMIGWQDSDSDGIFDVLDVPFTLRGSGYFDEATRIYHFTADSWVNTFANRNTEGTRNDLTINKIREVQYRVDGGAWQTLLSTDDYKRSLNLVTPVLAAGQHQVEIRTIDTRTGVASNIFVGGTDRPTSTLDAGIGGFVYRDLDGDGIWDANEPALRNWEVTLQGSGGAPIATPSRVEPDQFSENALLNSAVSGVTLTSVGSGVANNQVLAVTSASSATGTKAFANKVSETNQVSTDWTEFTRQLRADFNTPTNQVRLEAFGVLTGSIGRLEAYSSSGVLLGRYTTASLSGGSRETMTLTRPTADIAYVIARSHAGTTIRLDNLRFGPDANDKTDSQGAYAIDSAVTGSFQVQLTAPSGVTQTSPSNGIRTITPVAGQPLPNLDFGVNFATTWQNILNAFDVDNDGSTRISDALSVLEDITANGTRLLSSLAPNAPLPAKFLDVSGDGRLTAHDILLVIAEISRLLSAPTAEPESRNPSIAVASDGNASTGETEPTTPLSPTGEFESATALSPSAPTKAVDAWASWYGEASPVLDASNGQNGSRFRPRRRG